MHLVLVELPSLPPCRESWCPPTVFVNEASDVAFPGRIAPAIKARAAPPDQCRRGKKHCLPRAVGDEDRVNTGLRCRRGRIDVVTVAVDPNHQRATGFASLI